MSRDGAVDVVGARLQVDVHRRGLARLDGRRPLVDAVALHHEIVRDVPIVLHREAVRAGRDGRFRERDLELGLADGDRGRARGRRGGGGRRLRGRGVGRGLSALRLGLAGLASDEDHGGQHPDEQQHARDEEDAQPAPRELRVPARHQDRDDQREAGEAEDGEPEPDLLRRRQSQQQHRGNLAWLPA